MSPSRESAEPTAPRKDRVVQTRVPRDLEATLKEEARRRRLTVSHLIRNVLEDAFELVDGVVADVDQIVSDSMTLAKNVRDGARRITATATSKEAEAKEPHPEEGLDHVYAWNEVVLHRPATCSRCQSAIDRGERGFTGLSDEPGAPRAWLCGGCVKAL
jgi:hypothetical protein